jgi:hypothetical protein
MKSDFLFDVVAVSSVSSISNRSVGGGGGGGVGVTICVCVERLSFYCSTCNNTTCL